MFKCASVLAAAIGASSLLATPAQAARHQFSCYDYAWESQDQKDCLANPEHMPMHKMRHKRMHHGMTHMKGMKGMDDKDMPAHK